MAGRCAMLRYQLKKLYPLRELAERIASTVEAGKKKRKIFAIWTTSHERVIGSAGKITSK